MWWTKSHDSVCEFFDILRSSDFPFSEHHTGLLPASCVVSSSLLCFSHVESHFCTFAKCYFLSLWCPSWLLVCLSNIYLLSNLQLKNHLLAEICFFSIPLYFFIFAIQSWSASFSSITSVSISYISLKHIAHLYLYLSIFFLYAVSFLSSSFFLSSYIPSI